MKRSFAPLRRCVCFVILVSLAHCAYLPVNPLYQGPIPRPPALDAYYARGSSHGTVVETPFSDDGSVKISRIQLQMPQGSVTIDYFDGENNGPDLLLFFPMLGGRNWVENHFADYFARRGFDGAVIHRNNDIKDPKNVDRLEDLLRQSVVRDRIALDFFEKEKRKNRFGGFGISRGAMNLAISAGVDPRLKYNVLVMGASDLSSIMRRSNERKIKRYRETIMAERGLTNEGFYHLLKDQIRSDPRDLAPYLDARNTLMFLAVFDTTVPFKYGMRLRDEIGQPHTILLAGNHYTTGVFTGLVPLVPPVLGFSLFPLDYVETETLAFFNSRFERKQWSVKLATLRTLQLPFTVASRIYNSVRNSRQDDIDTGSTPPVMYANAGNP